VPRALEHALARDCIVELEQQDDRQRTVDVVEHRVERLGLREVARIPVENEAVLAALEDLALDDRDRDLVGDEFPVAKIRLDELAELRALRDVCAVEVAGRDVRDSGLLDDPRRLRPLPRPLRADDQDVQRRNPS